MSGDDRVQELARWLRDYGIAMDDDALSLMVRHLDLVVEKNKTVNLTRITSEHEALLLHILDSLLLVDAASSAPEGRYVDLGTGAGFPGLPIAIATHRESVLVDSVGKKVAAVEEFISALGMSDRVSARAIRAEDLARLEPRAYSLVTARAVAQINTLVEYASPLLAQGGLLVITKGRLGADELVHGDAAAKICGLKRVSRETFELPEELGHREIVVYEKVAKPSVRLPRNVGMAKHHPLGV